MSSHSSDNKLRGPASTDELSMDHSDHSPQEVGGDSVAATSRSTIQTSPSLNAVMDRVYSHPPPSSSPRQSSHTTTAGLIDMVADMIRGALHAPDTPQHVEQQQHVLTYRDLSSHDAAFMNWVSTSTTLTNDTSSNDDSILSSPSPSPRRRNHYTNSNKKRSRRKVHPRTDPFTIREGMTLSWKNVDLQVVTTVGSCE